MRALSRPIYAAHRLWATAPDGIQVPVSLVCRKGLALDGSSPCLLYSYGSYGASTEPFFRPNRLSLIERGFVFAVAHIRGGSEMGRAWYENQAVFDLPLAVFDQADQLQLTVNTDQIRAI